MYTPSQISALRELWRRGQAHRAILDEGQQDWRSRYYAAPPLSTQVWLIGRQRGKTFDALFIAIETCLSTPRSLVKYCAKTKESARSIVLPSWEFLVETLPPEWAPKKGKDINEYVFSNGSKFVLFGTDAQSFAKGRGPKSSLIILDEAGFYADFEKIESALIPSIQTTGGKVLYVSTPSETLAHPYNARIEAARQNGSLIHDTFYNNPRADHDAIIRAEASRRGLTSEQFVQSTYFRREYLAEQVQEETSSGMPDFVKIRNEIIVDKPLPKYYDGYVGVDLGITSDPHFAIFGIHDWMTNTLYVIDELESPSGTTTIKTFTEQIKAKEKELFGTDFWNGTVIGAKDWAQEFGGLPDYFQSEIQHVAPKQPYLRVGDPAGGFLKDMVRDYLLAVLPTEKTEKRMNADVTNNMLLNKKIMINPRCRKLIEQLAGVAWDTSRTKWQHGIYVTGGVHHFDGVDCLIYMARNVRWSRKAQLPFTPEERDAFQHAPEYLLTDDIKERRANNSLVSASNNYNNIFSIAHKNKKVY